ncbi:MAG: hypothetical protein ABSB70_17745 [Candidatus Velthaea sp.]|jgi:hypothetical protein
MTTNVTHGDATPPPAPDHQCINVSCGCNDLVSAGACSEWCMGHTTELADVERGKAAPGECNCGHGTCLNRFAAAGSGTPQRGMS